MKMQTYCVLQLLKYLQQFAACITNMSVTWPAGSCTVSSSKIVLLLHTMEGPYIDI